MPSAAQGFEHTDVDGVVVFVDMAGFTAFTEVHGDHRAARLAETFVTAATAALGPTDELIKTLGDAVMVTSEAPTTAHAFLRRLLDQTRRLDGFPLLRASIAAGLVVVRRGDVFGSTVNIAARLAAIAKPGQVVVNEAAASALRGADGVTATALGPLRLRNISAPVEAFALDIGTRHQEHVDPVCRMHVATSTTELTITQLGTSYRFCSTACMNQFAARVLGAATAIPVVEAGWPSAS